MAASGAAQLISIWFHGLQDPGGGFAVAGDDAVMLIQAGEQLAHFCLGDVVMITFHRLAHVLAVIDAAHQICPYSKAIRGNVDVMINLA